MTQSQYRLLLTIVLVNTVLLLVNLVFSGYVFYVVHHTVAALHELAESWKHLGL